MNDTAIRLPVLLLCATAAGCGDAPPETTYDTDVIGVAEQHLEPEFWVARAERADRVLMSGEEIAAFNAHAFANDDTMVDLRGFPRELAGADMRERITGISRRSSYDRFYPDGSQVDDADYREWEAALNLDALPDTVATRFGLVVRRSDLRTFPTDTRVISGESSADLDRFQEHGLFPGEAVAVLHDSADGEWLFVQSYNYAAWVRRENVGIGEHAQVFDFLDAGDFLVVTDDKVTTNYNPQVPAVSELQLDMGVRLPLASNSDVGHNLHGQNPYASYVVRLPLRDDDGRLAFEHALIARSEDVSIGYLPYTRANVIRQGFRFLGERYGWGHDYNGRDCTGFVSEVYKSFGLLMPRNSGDQGSSVIGSNRRFDDDAGDPPKLAALDDAAPGALVYIPGHVAMIIGEIDGEPWIIHDVAGLRYARPDGSQYSGLLHGVSVTPLLPMRASAKRRYLDRVYNIKSIDSTGAITTE